MDGIHSEAQRHIDGISARDLKLQAEKVGEAWAGATTNTVALGGATVGLGMMGVQFLAKSFISALSKSIMKLLQWTKEFLTKERHLFYINSNPSQAIKSIEDSASQTSPKQQDRQGISLRQKVWETIKSLKNFIFKRSEGKVEISEEIPGNKQEQAQKFLRLLNTPAGEQAPEGLEKMKVKVEGKELIIVDKQGTVIANDIQPLMATETVQAALEENQVELPNAPLIEPILGSLAETETQIQSDVLAAQDRQEIVNNQIQQELAEVKAELDRGEVELVEPELSSDLEISSSEVDDDYDYDNFIFNQESTETVTAAQIDLPIPPPPAQSFEPELQPVATEVEPEFESISEPEIDPAKLESQFNYSIPLTESLREELATVAQLHQLGTPAETSTLVLVDKNELEAGTLTQTRSKEGDATYQFKSGAKQFTFTINPDRIVTNLTAASQIDFKNNRHLISSLAKIINHPKNTDLQLHTDSQIEQVAMAQQLVKTLDELEESNHKPKAKAVVTIDGKELDITQDKPTQTIIITDSTTAQTMTFKKGQGMQDGGMLKTMMSFAAENGQSLAKKFIDMAQDQIAIAKDAIDNAMPNIVAGIEEGARRDRFAREAFTANVVQTVGAKIDGFMGAVVNNLTPQSLTEPMGQMRRIEQVESGTSERVEDVFSLLEADENKSEEAKQLTLEEQFKQNIKHHPSAQPSPDLAIGQ